MTKIKTCGKKIRGRVWGRARAKFGPEKSRKFRKNQPVTHKAVDGLPMGSTDNLADTIGISDADLSLVLNLIPPSSSIRHGSQALV